MHLDSRPRQHQLGGIVVPRVRFAAGIELEHLGDHGGLVGPDDELRHLLRQERRYGAQRAQASHANRLAAVTVEDFQGSHRHAVCLREPIGMAERCR